MTEVMLVLFFYPNKKDPAFIYGILSIYFTLIFPDHFLNPP